jgi:hypothetical protein
MTVQGLIDELHSLTVGTPYKYYDVIMNIYSCDQVSPVKTVTLGDDCIYIEGDNLKTENN